MTTTPSGNSTNLICAVINAAEKAANIARVCRANPALLSLLVQEKTGNEANARFEHDFKTLADVLIQETIKNDIGALFPEMREAIKGEESSSFTNSLGETISVVIGSNEEETSDCLKNVLNGNIEAAKALSCEVHRTVKYENEEIGDIPELPNDMSYANLGIWIDPIDATAEYINGDTVFSKFPGITSSGLDCVTVLIGVYEWDTGVPIIGVIAQPFHNKVDENIYTSQICWGLALPELKANNCAHFTHEHGHLLGIFSSSEKPELLQYLKSCGYEFVFSAGAGHKALKVITNEADIYLISKGSTFKWDTCGPQAILRSLGGNIFDLKGSIKEKKLVPLSYEDEERLCNDGGLVAARNVSLIELLLKKFVDDMMLGK